jgi:glycosyltransferase involved in cell wall biosynthesis
MPEPLVSAMIPTYRRPAIVGRSIEGVLRQTHRPLELIVINDGSGDETQSVLAGYEERAAKAGVAYRYLETPNGGLGAARTRALEEANGEYLAYDDDDDVWFERKVEIQLAAMRANPDYGVSFTQFVHEGKPGTPKPRPDQMRQGWVFADLCTGDTRAHVQTLMVHRRVWEKIGGFARYPNFMDTHYNLKAALEFQFLAVVEPLTTIFTPPATMSRAGGTEGDIKRDHTKLGVLDDFEKEFAGHPRFDPAAFAVQRARIYDEHIKHLLWLGDVEGAQQGWAHAVEACGEQPMLIKLKRKLKRARIAGWFGLKLAKPE